jgi:hypothetical protein
MKSRCSFLASLGVGDLGFSREIHHFGLENSAEPKRARRVGAARARSERQPLDTSAAGMCRQNDVVKLLRRLQRA